MGGGSYNMSVEGYYYLVDFNRGISRNFIVYNDDVKALLSALSYLHVHGNLDDKLSKTDMLKKMTTKKISLTCGNISMLVLNILKEYNVESRLVSFLTMDKWNSYDNGHTLIEVKIDGKWVLLDIDNNRYFKLYNKNMNLLDFFNDLDWNDIAFSQLSEDENLDSQNFTSNSISYHGFADYIYSDIRKWYKRVMQIPMIFENDIRYVGLKDENNRDRVLEYYPNAKILTQQEFRKKFYGDL